MTMIKIIRELENGKVEIMSKSGKLLDIGAGAVQKMIVHRSEIPYVDEEEPEKPEEPEPVDNV